MAVYLSPVGGVAAQFFDNNGTPLAGGLIYTYAAGTSTPQTTYTSSSGIVAHSNPIVLDASGRVPSGEIWLSDGIVYKFVIKTSTDVLIASYDNVIGINSNFIAYTAQQEIQTATAGQTVFILSTVNYQPGTNNLSVFVDGVNQYGPGAQYAYIETSSNTVTFVNGLHVGASVKFTTATPVSSANSIFSVSFQDFGANGNGISDTTSAILAAETNVPVFAQKGNYLTTIPTPSDLSGRQWGVGQVITADSNKAAPNFSIVENAPATTGSENSFNTAFTGDFTYCQNAQAHLIRGVDTLGQPATGYLYTPEAMANYTYFQNESGWNEDTAGNTGRTGVAAYRVKLYQNGQGDAVCFNGSVFVTGTRAGSTNFLANPAGVLFNGDMTAGADGTYLNPYETVCTDNGYDIAAVGLVNRFERTNNTGDKNVVWMGYRSQSTGTKPIDAFVSAQGYYNNGFDVTTADFGTNQCAVSLKASQRIYFNNTATPPSGGTIAFVTNNYGGEYLAYSGAVGQTQFFGQNTVQFAVGRTASAVNYFVASGAGTGGLARLQVFGSDTNAGADYIAKGTGYHFFCSNSSSSNVQFAIQGNVTSSVNYASAFGAATGNTPGFVAAGADTNIDIKLAAKGSGVVDLGTQTAGSAGGASGYMVIKVSGTSYKVPLYAM